MRLHAAALPLIAGFLAHQNPAPLRDVLSGGQSYCHTHRGRRRRPRRRDLPCRRHTDLGKLHYGLALAYRQHGERYAASEADAKEARRGMWNGTFMQPSEWRHSHGQ